MHFSVEPQGQYLVATYCDEKADTLDDALDISWEMLEETPWDEDGQIDIYEVSDDGVRSFRGSVFWTEPEIMFDGEE